MLLHKTLIAFTAAAALGCLPFATNAFAAPGHPGGHPGGHATAHASGHAMHARGGRVGARYGYRGGYGAGPVYDSCAGYAYGNGYYGYNNGCPGYGVPLVGGVINGILGGYGPF
jgi:hypothetical protein